MPTDSTAAPDAPRAANGAANRHYAVAKRKYIQILSPPPVQRPFLLLGLVILFSGCAGGIKSSTPPKSQIRVDDAYVAPGGDGPQMSVVLGPVVVTDEGVTKHLGGTPASADSTYRAFFAERLPVAFQTTHVRDARVLDPAAYDRAGGGPRPADGVRLVFEGFSPDLVLLLDTLHVYRASYFSYNAVSGGGTREGLRLDTDVVLWDNRTGREVASGRLEAEREIGALTSMPGRGVYEKAVAEFVEQLARYTPIKRD